MSRLSPAERIFWRPPALQGLLVLQCEFEPVCGLMELMVIAEKKNTHFYKEDNLLRDPHLTRCAIPSCAEKLQITNIRREIIGIKRQIGDIQTLNAESH